MCLYLCTVNFFAQSFIKGKILEKPSKETLPGVTVACGTIGAITDVDGNFFLTVPPGKQTLVAGLVGYKTYRQDLDCKANDTISLQIQLETVNRVLDEVVISAGKYE